MRRRLSVATLAVRGVRALMILLLVWGSAAPGYAHNAPVHSGMAQKAFDFMEHPDVERPTDAMSEAAWARFRGDMETAVCNMRNAVADPSATLGDAAAMPDKNTRDSVLFVKPLGVGGASWVTHLADEVEHDAIAIALVPFVCAASCLASLFGLGGDDTCRTCVRAAKDLADKVPDAGDLANLVPGVGAITDADKFTGLWHFVNMAPEGVLQNEYDDHQGLYYDEAGPNQVPGAMDLAAMAAMDFLSLSVDPVESHGVEKYQQPNSNDAFPDGDHYTGTRMRGDAAWQKHPVSHTPFEPVDNLGLYGWRQFQAHQAPTLKAQAMSDLGYPLHALGDATVPMHVTGTSAWGHRPYEDAHEELWNRPVGLQTAVDSRRVLARAFVYREQILAWRVAGHARDIPVRALVRAVARHTYDYAFDKTAQTATSIFGPWPFNDATSVTYFLTHDLTGDDLGSKLYRERPDAVALGLPLIEDGLAAQVALLTSAYDSPGCDHFVAHPTPGPPPGGASFAQGSDAAADQPAPPTPGPGTDSSEPAQPSAAEAQFLAALRTDYARLAQQFIVGRLTPAQYLQRVRDRTRKARLAAATPGYYESFARGDADGDLVPDDRDPSPGTPQLSPTDDQGRPVADRPAGARGRAGGPSSEDMRAIFAKLKLAVAPRCADQPPPETPDLVRMGFADTGPDLLFAVTRVGAPGPDCPVFYEFGVRVTHRTQLGASPPTYSESYRQVVFRSDEGREVRPGQVLFRIRQGVPQPQDRGDLRAEVEHAFVAHGVKWRVRAIGANGMGSTWTEWRTGADPLAFGPL